MSFWNLFQRQEPQLLDQPWRKIPSGEKAEYLQKINNFRPKRRDVQHIRILLYGIAGAGKSSFINSVETALRGQITCQALADSISHSSFTTEYATHEIPQNSGKLYPFVFNDIMGLGGDNAQEEKKVVCVDDIKLALKGHVKDGYKFDSQRPLERGDEKYQSNPTVNDKTHVLVCVVSSSTAALMSTDSMRKLREVRLAARDLGIPQMAVLTKIDEACRKVQSDINNVYKSIAIKRKMEELSAFLGIPLNCIFPVKNYSEEISTDDGSDKFILMALKQMIDFGEDFVNKQILNEPWRKIPPNTKKDVLQYLNNDSNKKDIRIMLYGPSGAGRSSFINSVERTFRGRMTCQALADGHDSFTTKYQTYKILKHESFYPFVFTDVMCLEKNSGVCLDDIKLALKGHVKDGYVFDLKHPLGSDDEMYQRNPTLNDKTHVLVCVVPASTASIQTADFTLRMKEVGLAARLMGIPQMAILTKIDEACSEVQSDIGNVYKSKFLKGQMEELSRSLGIPLNCIFPVKNYHSETDADDDIETLIMMALKHMIDFGEDFVDKQFAVELQA